MVTNLYNIYLRSGKVTTDSRDCPQGSVFFALRGEKFDGNRYASAALGNGASYAVVDDPQVVADDRYILVENVLETLQDLASFHRSQLKIPVIGITGTNGKTTTKELLALMLSNKYITDYTRGNLNNHIGVPLTLLSLTRQTEIAVIEMGASSVGEIALLCSIARPDHGMITNIGLAHLEGFGSPENIAAGKGELYDHLDSVSGTAFVHKEDDLLYDMALERTRMKKVYYSELESEGINSSLAGRYNYINISAASSVARYFGVSHAAVKQAVEGYRPDNKRSQYKDTGRNHIILDCYNANPSSMRVACENFIASDSPFRKVAILGDMLELGGYSHDSHRRILELFHGVKDVELLLVGKNFMEVAGGHSSYRAFPDTTTLIDYLSRNKVENKLILIKGSRGINLDKVEEVL